jgi:hypothetical protein
MAAKCSRWAYADSSTGVTMAVTPMPLLRRLRCCNQAVNPTPGFTHWAWGDGRSSLKVEVQDSGIVSITRGMVGTINDPAC